MSDSTARRFAIFQKETVKPTCAAALKRTRNCLYYALGVGLAVFLIFAGLMYLFFVPHRDTMSAYGVRYWPLVIFASMAFGVLAFCFFNIFWMKRIVDEFRGTVFDKLAAFIDPATVHETGKTLPIHELERDLLSAAVCSLLSGTEQFHTQIPGAAAHFSPLQAQRGSSGTGGNSGTLTGLYFYAIMEREFPVPVIVLPSSVKTGGDEAATQFLAGTGVIRFDDPSCGRQVVVPAGGEEFVLKLLSSPAFSQLEELGVFDGVEVYLSCRGNCLRVALLSRGGQAGLPDGFDFGHSQEFCRHARLCLDLAIDIAARNDSRLEQKAVVGM